MSKIRSIKYLLGFLILSIFLLHLVTEQNSVADHTSTDLTSSTDSSISSPDGIAIHEWTLNVYVGNTGSNKATIVNGSNLSVLGTLTGLDMPVDLDVNEISGKLYVINQGAGTVRVYNTNNNNQLDATITVGTTPSGVATSDYIGQVFVSNTGSDSVSIINESTNTVTSTVTGLSSPQDGAVNRYYNEFYLANSGADTMAVIAPFESSGIFLQNTVGDNPVDVAVNEEEDLIFVANNAAADSGDSISVIDSSTLVFDDIATIDLTDGSNPVALATNTCRDELYVANAGTNNVQIIDTSASPTFTITHTISVTNPTDIAVDPYLKKLYVTRSSSNIVSVFSIAGCVGPDIISITASDPNGGTDTGFSVGDVIIVKFDEYTNTPFGTVSGFETTDDTLTRSEVDALFTFSAAIGAASGEAYTAEWFDESTLIITVADVGSATPTIGGLTLTVKVGANLKDAWLTSDVSTSLSPVLAGSFAQKAGPGIFAVEAFDPTGQEDTNFSNGDGLAVLFDEETNMPFAGTDNILTRSEVDALFTFSEAIGAASGEAYTAEWFYKEFLIITVADVGSATPTIGGLTLTVKVGANLKDDTETSGASVAVSPPLDGSFGPWIETITVSSGGEGSTTTPDGTIVYMDLPPGVTDTITFDETTASTTGPNGETLEFIGDPIDVDTANAGSCANGCIPGFRITDEQLAADSLTLADLQFYHDKNNDGDFADAGEVNDNPTITPASPPGPYKITSTATSTSKFAVGGIRALALGGVGDIFPPTITMSKSSIDNLPLPENVLASIINQGPDNPILPSSIPSVDYSLTIDDKGFILTSYSNTILTNTVETGKPVNLKLLLFENSGLSSIEHVALYTNLRGIREEIADSNTYIIYEKGKQLQITDPNGFFSKVDLVTSQVGKKLQLSFEITFAKPMETSHIILRSWDERRNSGDTKIYNAIKVVEGYQEDTLQNEVSLPDTVTSESISQDSQKEESHDLMPTIKKWGGYSAEYASDSELLKEIGIDAEYMPSWIKKLSRWIVNENITQEEFINAIKYLHERGIIT